MADTTDPIHAVLERWHEHMAFPGSGILDDLLHDDVVFLSPVVFTPQEGKAITLQYLSAAGQTLGGDDATGSGAGGFRYVKEIAQGHHAVLEFESSVGGKYINGIDLITCDDDARIVEFKVMVRPLQAVNAVHAAMGQALEAMAPKG